MGFLNRMRLISKYYRPFSAPDAAVPQGGGSFIPALLCSIGVPAAVFGSGYIGFSVAAALPVAGVGAVAAGLALLILPILAGAVSCYLLLSLVVRLSAAVSDNEQACCDARNSFEAFRRMDYRAQAEYLRQLPKNLGGSLRGVQCSTGLLNEFLDLAIEKLENPALADEVKQTAFRSVASMYVYMCIVSAKCDATSSITKRLQQAFFKYPQVQQAFFGGYPEDIIRGEELPRGNAERTSVTSMPSRLQQLCERSIVSTPEGVENYCAARDVITFPAKTPLLDALFQRFQRDRQSAAAPASQLEGVVAATECTPLLEPRGYR